MGRKPVCKTQLTGEKTTWRKNQFNHYKLASYGFFQWCTGLLAAICAAAAKAASLRFELDFLQQPQPQQHGQQ